MKIRVALNFVTSEFAAAGVRQHHRNDGALRQWAAR
jgi:hypothetical protein